MQKFKIFLMGVGLSLCMAITSLPVYAQESTESDIQYSDTEDFYYNYYENAETGYFCWVYDEADLLNENEEMDLTDRLYSITEYGNAMIATISENSGSAEDYARDFLHENSGQRVSGTLFLIDMDNRKLYIFSDGDIYKTVTKGRADTITDNVYTYASDGQYYNCACAVIDQELTILEGGRIAQPMKYVSNVFIALIMALMINYFIVIWTSSVKKPSNSSVIQAAKCQLNVGKSSSVHISTTRKYDPPSDSGSGGGGGGSSGGGGGHSF